MKQNKNFLKLLIDCRLSKAEVARKIGVSWQTVYYWSIGRNKPSAQKIIELSEILGISGKQTLELLSEKPNQIKEDDK